MQRVLIVSCLLVVVPAAAFAGVEHLAMMYGLSPADIAMAGARASGFASLDMAYHNPASLADNPYAEVVVGYTFGQPDIKGGLAGEERHFYKPNAIVGVGVSLPLGRLFRPDYPLGMGINLLVDDNFRALVYFDDQDHPSGDFARYGRRNFTLAHGLGVRAVVPWLNVGVGYLLTYTADVKITQDVQINGSTENEQIRLVGQPSFIPLAGLQFKTGPVDIGVVYRARLIAVVDPVTGNTSPRAGETVIDEYPTEMEFNDGFAPQQIVLGIHLFPHEMVSGVLQGEYHNWAQLNDWATASGKSSRSLDVRTQDLFVPRAALTARPLPGLEVRGGYAYEPTPFARFGRDANLVLDSDRHRIGVGLGYTGALPFLSAPFSVDAAGLYLPLVPQAVRTVDKQSLRSSGYVLGGSLAVTLRY